MRRILQCLVVSLVAWIGAVVQALAAPVLSIERVGPGVIGLGDSAVFELRISGLEEILGAFSVDIAFDPAVLGFLPAASLNAQFGDHLGIPDTETVGIAEVTAPGVLHVDQVSLLDVSSLFVLQTDAAGAPLPSLLLALLTFEGIAPGTSLIAAVDGSSVFVDSIGQPIAPPLNAGAVISVPVPGTLALLIAGAWAAALLPRGPMRRPARHPGRA